MRLYHCRFLPPQWAWAQVQAQNALLRVLPRAALLQVPMWHWSYHHHCTAHRLLPRLPLLPLLPPLPPLPPLSLQCSPACQ